MSIDVSSLSLDEVKSLQVALQKRLDAQKADDLRAQIVKLCKDAGLDVQDVIAPLRASKPAQTRSKGAVAVKYRKEDNTWTGRGKRPAWVTQHLENGGTLDELLVSAS